MKNPPTPQRPAKTPSPPLLSSRDAQAIRLALAAWFERNRRSFPWRSRRTPYRVWVAEIMLQQTRADQALPYYKAFMKRFPTLHALAHAPREAVLKAWEGLGYYGRARRMHETAGLITRHHGGRFPRSREGLLALPGIGPYSAAAIASLAMNLPHAVVDGNVMRVLARLFLLEAPGDTAAGKQTFQAWADLLLDQGHPGRHNEAMMELGALCCLPAKPACNACPLASQCGALQAHAQHDYPKRQDKRKIPHVHVVAGIVVDARDRILIAQRRDHDMLGGLWEFPGGKREADETDEACIRRELQEEMGILTRIGPPLMTVHHAYSHFIMDLHARWGRIEKGRPRPIECAATRWVPRSQLEQFPMSRADDHIRQRLKQTPTPSF